MSLNNALVESLERNMEGQISKFSLSFSSRRIEREYRSEALRKRGVQLCIIMGSICLFQLCMFIMQLSLSNGYLIASAISAPAHLLGYLFKRKYPHESYPEFTVAFFSVFNQVTYDLMLNDLSYMNAKYMILGEFFITIVISIFFRTRVFVLDCLLLIFTRSFHTYFLEHIFSGGEVGIASVLTFLQVIMMAFYFYKSEKMEREKFLLKGSHSEWTEIIDKVLPVNVIISKFNQRTCEIMLGSCNGLSTKVFKIKDHESYNAMLSKIKISVGTDVENPNGSSLRDFVLHKHFSIAEGKSKGQNMKTNPSLNELDNNNNTKPKKTKTLPKNKKSHDTFFNRNFINLIKSENPINNANSNRSNDIAENIGNPREQQQAGVEDKLKLISLRSLSNIGISNNNNNVQANPVNPIGQAKIESSKVENLVGFYREKDFSVAKKYNIKIYKMSAMGGDSDSTLVISLEDRTHTATLKIQKEQNQSTHQVLSKTLQHFQILVKRAMNSVNEGSSQFIPPLLLYNTLLLNMQIYNINDYLKIKLANNKNVNNSTNNKSAMNAFNNTTSAAAAAAAPEKDKYPQDPMNSSVQQAVESSSKDNKNQFYFETLELSELLSQLEKLMKRVCEERNIVFVLINETPEDQTIITDKHKLYRVLINYISNSVNKTKKGYIQLKAISTATLGIPTIKFQVIDSGSGMSPRQQLHQITQVRSNQNFDDYEEQISPTTKKGKGMQSNVLRASVGDKRHYKHLPLAARNGNSNQLGNNSSNVNNNNNPSFQFSMNNSASNFISTNNNNSNNGLFLQKNTSVIYQSNTSEDIGTSALFPNSSIIAGNSTNTDIAAAERQKKSIIKEGLGIGMLVSKYLINKMGPSFPKVYSKAGLGTNVTFEVYQDLQKMIYAHQSSYQSAQFPQSMPLQPTQLKKNSSKMSSFNFHNINSSPQQGPGGNSNNNNALRDHLSSSSVINIATLNSNVISQGNNPVFAPSPGKDTHTFFFPISNALGNLNSSINPNNNNANPLHKSYQSSEIFGNLDGNNNIGNSAGKSRSQKNEGQIHLDAEENVDEDGLEYLNLGGNCYKMISCDDHRLVVSRSDNYLMQAEAAETNASFSLQFLAQQQYYNAQKKPQSIIQIGSANPSFMNVATAGYSQSQLQPFSNAEIFPQQPHFGLNTSQSKNNSSKNEANSPQNVNNNNYNSNFASFNNNSNTNNNVSFNNNSIKGGRPAGAFNFDKLNIVNLSSANNNPMIQGSSVASFPKTSFGKIDESLGLSQSKRESGETLVGGGGGGQRSPRSALSGRQQQQQSQSNTQQQPQQQTPLQQAYSLKLIQSFPDALTTFIENNPNGHPHSNPTNNLNKTISPLLAHLQQASEHSNNSLSGNQQEELGNFTSELHKAFNSIHNTNPQISSNINNNHYHQKKPSMKSSFNLIFDMKSNAIDYDPESQHNNSNLNINNSNLINELTSHKPSPQSNSFNELSPHPQKTVKFSDNARATLDEGLTADQLFGGLTNPTRGRAISAKVPYSKQEYYNKINQFQSSTLTSTQVLTAPAPYGFHSTTQPRERALSSLPQSSYSSRSGKNYRISIGNPKEPSHTSHKLSQ